MAKNEPASEIENRAGAAVKRLLAARDREYLEDLDPEDARELMRGGWREAAAEMFASDDLALMHAEIDIMIDSLVMDLHLNGLGKAPIQ